MATQRTLKNLYTIHSWAGIVTGLLLFIVCFSGAVVVFKHEIDLWANPSLAQLPHAATPARLDVVLSNVLAAYPGGRIDSITMPDAVNPAYFVFVREAGQPAAQRIKIALRADTGAVVGPVDSQLGQFLRSLHVFLFFGPRWIVGFLGVAMLVLIGTGFVIHRKILAELFTQRWGRSFRLVMSDLHKAAGVWSLAFHLLIALTGAWLGLVPVFEQGAAFVVKAQVSADQPKTEKAKSPDELADMQSLDALRATALAALPDLEPAVVSLRNWGQPDAQATFSGALQGHLASTARVQLAGVTGAVTLLHDPRNKGFWTLVNGLMESLHFGNFGGIVLKWCYFLLGLTPAFLSISGTLLWLERRRQRREGFVEASAMPVIARQP